MKVEYLEKLHDIGLSDKEARAYLALLELGRGSAASVATKSGLKPPTAYLILKELISRGYVRRVPKAKKQLFVAESPDLVLASVEKRLGNFKSVMPALTALAQGGSMAETRTLFFEGLSGMERAFAYRRDELKDMEYLAYYASAEDISKELEAVLLDWSRKMAKANATSRAIVPDHPSLSMWREKDTDFKRTVKVLPPETYSSKSAIEIFPGFVRISLYGQLQCTIIEDVEFAAAQRQIFELVWSSRN